MAAPIVVQYRRVLRNLMSSLDHIKDVFCTIVTVDTVVVVTIPEECA